MKLILDTPRTTVVVKVETLVPVRKYYKLTEVTEYKVVKTTKFIW